MRRNAGVVGLAVTSLLLALWVTAGADRVPIVRPSRRSSEGDLQRQLTERADGTAPLDPSADDGRLPFGLELAFNVLGVVFIALLVGWLVWAGIAAFRGRRRFRESRRPDAVPPHVAHEEFLEATRQAVGAATREQLARLREGEPRNAIVACWVALEDAVTRAGVARDVAETSTELTTRILGRIAVDENAVTGLNTLYREARFSRHPMGEAQRERAISLLTRLSEDLGRGRVAATSATAGSPRRESPETSP